MMLVFLFLATLVFLAFFVTLTRVMLFFAHCILEEQGPIMQAILANIVDKFLQFFLFYLYCFLHFVLCEQHFAAVILSCSDLMFSFLQSEVFGVDLLLQKLMVLLGLLLACFKFVNIFPHFTDLGLVAPLIDNEVFL